MLNSKSISSLCRKIRLADGRCAEYTCGPARSPVQPFLAELPAETETEAGNYIINNKKLTESVYAIAAFKLGIKRSAATISKNVGESPADPNWTNAITKALSLNWLLFLHCNVYCPEFFISV